VTFIKLKAKIIRYNIFFLETQKNKLLYILMYTNKVQVFFLIFSVFFQGCWQPLPQHGKISLRESCSSLGGVDDEEMEDEG